VRRATSHSTQSIHCMQIRTHRQSRPHCAALCDVHTASHTASRAWHAVRVVCMTSTLTALIFSELFGVGRLTIPCPAREARRTAACESPTCARGGRARVPQPSWGSRRSARRRARCREGARRGRPLSPAGGWTEVAVSGRRGRSRRAPSKGSRAKTLRAASSREPAPSNGLARVAPMAFRIHRLWLGHKLNFEFIE